MIAAISRERGVELVMTFNYSINTIRFKIFLEELRRRNLFSNIFIMMDNLAVHRSQYTIEGLDELGFRHAWTPRYSP